MANKFIPQYHTASGAYPTASSLDVGELAINLADGRLFTRDHLDRIIYLAAANPDSSSYAVTSSYTSNTAILGVQFGDGVNAAPTTSMIVATIPYNCRIIKSEVDADVSGTATINILRATSALPGTFVSIVGTNKPSLSFQQHTTDSSLPTWTSSLFIGDKLKFTLDTLSGSALVHNALYLIKV